MENNKAIKPPTSLIQLQSWLKWAITQSQVEIYSNAYFERLVESLSKDFEILFKILEESSFRKIIRDYLSAYPSTSTNISEVGRYLPKFLKNYAFTVGLPFLADLAKLEWTLIEAFYANDVPPLNQNNLAMFAKNEDAWLGAKIKLDPSVYLLRVQWPVDEVWKKRKFVTSAHFKQACYYLLIYRINYRLEVERLNLLQWKILNLLVKGHSLGEVFKKVQDLAHEDGGLFQKWFQHWASQGVIRNILVHGAGQT